MVDANHDADPNLVSPADSMQPMMKTPGIQNESVTKKLLPTLRQLPSPLASEDETPIRRINSNRHRTSQSALDVTDGFIFQQPEKPYNPKRPPVKDSIRIFEKAFSNRNKHYDVKIALSPNRHNLISGKGAIFAPMGIAPSRTPGRTPSTVQRTPSTSGNASSLGKRSPASLRRFDQPSPYRITKPSSRRRDLSSAVRSIPLCFLLFL